MQRNAAVLHQILNDVADHWSLGVIAIFHLRLGITAVNHMPSLGDMAVLAGVKLGFPYLRVVVEILGDKAIEWFLDMIITNSNDTIVTSTMLSCIKCNALNNQGGTHGSDEL